MAYNLGQCFPAHGATTHNGNIMVEYTDSKDAALVGHQYNKELEILWPSAIVCKGAML